MTNIATLNHAAAGGELGDAQGRRGYGETVREGKKEKKRKRRRGGGEKKGGKGREERGSGVAAGDG